MKYVNYLITFNYLLQKRIFSFNSETRIWTNIGISVYGNILSIFVDKQHTMTLQAIKEHNSKSSTIYRFSLR
jgi:hypothetical protein